MDAVEPRLATVETELREFRVEVRQEFEKVRQDFVAVRKEIRAGDEETRRLMRVLHEDLVERITKIGEGSRPPNGQRGSRKH
jgi:phosphoribosylamine-glycine ligase